MALKGVCRYVFFLALLLASAVVLGAAGGAAASGTVGLVGGGAYGESVSVQPVLGPAVTSGPMPTVTLPATGGGPFTANLVSLVIPRLLEAHALSVSTQGALGTSGFVASSAQAANTSAAAGIVNAGVVSSRCRIDSSGAVTGSAAFANLTVLGSPVSGNPAPNTTIPLAGVGTLILNEQTTTTGLGGLRSITVNAIHLKLAGTLGTGDIIVSQSRCIARI
jgi:hypothetical protein